MSIHSTSKELTNNINDTTPRARMSTLSRSRASTFRRNSVMVIHESMLSKKGKHGGKMQCRFCRVRSDRTLAYYENQQNPNPKGIIHLSTVQTINIYCTSQRNKIQILNQNYPVHFKEEPLKSRGSKHCDFGFELVTKDRVWIFGCSEGLNVLTQWIRVLCQYCFGTPVHCGFLHKLGEKYKTWRRRWFIIYDLNEMRYFENDSLSEYKGTIQLDTVSKVKERVAENTDHYRHCIELHTPQRVWMLATRTNHEKQEWIRRIQSTMKSNLRKFVPSRSGQGFLSVFDPNESTASFRKLWTVLSLDSRFDHLAPRICCFERQIDCKQLERLKAVNGNQQFTEECDDKMDQWLPLRDIQKVTIIGSDSLKMDIEWEYLLKVQMNSDCDGNSKEDDHGKCLYFAPHPNSHQNAQRWAEYIRNDAAGRSSVVSITSLSANSTAYRPNVSQSGTSIVQMVWF